MKKLRYMVVEHSRDEEELYIENGEVVGQVPIHHLLGAYHWTRLDDQHVLLMGSYSISHHATLANHEKVSVLPVMHSSKYIQNHEMKEQHKQALRAALRLDDDHTMEHVIEKLETHHSPIFAAHK